MKKIIFVLITFLLFACQTEKENMTLETKNQWALIEGTHQGKTLTPVAGHQITLQMFPDHWAGSAGVNFYQISVKYLQNQQVEVTKGSAISTRMAGDPEAMNMEYRYLHALSEITKTMMTGNQLVLSGEEVRLVFQAK